MYNEINYAIKHCVIMIAKNKMNQKKLLLNFRCFTLSNYVGEQNIYY